MGLILAIDGIADRYSLLPSEVLQRASTFDLFILDTVVTFQNQARARAEGNQAPPDLSQEELLEILKSSKGE